MQFSQFSRCWNCTLSCWKCEWNVTLAVCRNVSVTKLLTYQTWQTWGCTISCPLKSEPGSIWCGTANTTSTTPWLEKCQSRNIHRASIPEYIASLWTWLYISLLLHSVVIRAWHSQPDSSLCLINWDINIVYAKAEVDMIILFCV